MLVEAAGSLMSLLVWGDQATEYQSQPQHSLRFQNRTGL